MTAELRNLPHIASMAFNEPLMLEPAYARVFFCALAGQLGISRLTDAVSGDSLTAQEALATLALSGDDDGPRQARSYQVMNGIAVLPVSGTLVSRTRALQPYSGMTGYNGIIARLQQAASDPMVDGILLDMDTPGGMVAGAFDCADIIARVRDIKPVWALANDMNCSAGQLLASAASRRLVTQTARTGSIGVMMAHSNYGAALEKQGVEITLIYSGSHKVDGNPYSHLPDDVRETLQSRMDATRQMFAQKVSAYTGLSVQAVLDTEAAVYSGQEAIDAGLADELVNSTDAITVIRDALDARKSRLSGGRMTKETQSTTVYRRRRIIMQNMRDEELAIAQVEEMQAVSAVLKGKYTMTGEAFDPVEVDIGAHTHSVAIGSHGHTITVNAAGNAENTVKNIAFNYIVRLA